MKKYSYHPAANIFPLNNDGPEFDALVANIKRSGLHHPIILHEGKILDGRRRYLACQRAGVTAKFLQWNGKGSPLDYVVSSNVHRRELNPSQVALVALRMLPLLKAEAKERQRLSKGRGIKGAQSISTSFGKAAAQAARAVGCGTRIVEMAKKVLDVRPDLIEQIEKGSMTINVAYEEVVRSGSKSKEERLPSVPRRNGLYVASIPVGFKPDAKFICGDSLSSLRTLPSDSVHCCVTSPPYYQLRDYECDGQYGLEPTIAEYITKQVEVFQEVRRVLRKDGTCWINVGDRYASSSTGNGLNLPKRNVTSLMAKARKQMSTSSGLQPKNLLLIPQRLILALQDDGWIVRQDITLWKTNAAAEGTKDRPIRSHEYLFLITKSEKYYFDCDVLREPYEEATIKRRKTSTPRLPKSSDYDRNYELHPHGKLRGSVWRTAPSNGAGDHPAPMSLKLAVDCVRAGCPENGTVIDPFAGSGTTAVAAVENCRHCIGIDLSRKYLGITLKRLPGAKIVSSMEDSEAA